MERFAIVSSLILDLFFLGTISVSRVGSGATRGANGWHKYLGRLDLKFTAARSQKDKTLEVTPWVYTVSNGNSVNTWKINGLFNSPGSFITYFVTSFLILKSNLRDINSRLRGCGICASEIYFSIFLESNEGKRLK